MPLGIRPVVDFAFKKIFGSPENKQALISLLNSILKLDQPIVDVTIQNPFNYQDFEVDKLSVLDIRAVDGRGFIFNIEMQISVLAATVKRFVYYSCKLVAGQLQSGDDYDLIQPVFTICILDGVLWRDSRVVHHRFQLADLATRRVLAETLEIHTLELGKYNLSTDQLATTTGLDCWLSWFLHAHEFTAAELRVLFPRAAIQQATNALETIAMKTDDKQLYELREKAIRDQDWAINAARREGQAEGRAEGKAEGRSEGELIGKIRNLQELLGMPIDTSNELVSRTIGELEQLSCQLQQQLRSRIREI